MYEVFEQLLQDNGLSAFKWLSKLWYVPFYNIGIDDWQGQIDNCPKGKRTKLNMRVLIGHTSEDMLRYYQDVDYADLRKITDNI